MKRFVVFASLALVLVFAMSAVAADLPHFKKGTGVDHGAPIGSLKAERDTVYICGAWGSGAAYNGQFEDINGLASWNGWTHRDNTYKTASFWNVSNYNADTLGSTPFVGNLAAWCGYPWVACTNDEQGGYGNGWYEVMEWRTFVGDNTQPTTVDWDFYISYDSENAYDFTYVYYFDSVGENELAAYDQTGVNEHAVFNFSYLGNDYAGDLGDEIVLQLVFSSDSGWSDEDCLFSGVGGCQIDEINIVCTGASNATSFTDFEDGTFGDWTPLIDPNFVGDFAMLRSGLGDVDPCATNSTYQATFIDDGVVVPGTGGTQGINWKYGPGGFIVTTEGGLAGPTYYIDNQITSPPMVWPEPANDGCIFAFDGYAHEDLDADAPGVFYIWGVRSTPSTNPDDIIYSGWKDRNFVYYGDPLYARRGDNVTDLMMIDRQFVQVRMAVLEYGYVWGWTGRDGYPAPYFDNVQVKCYPFLGPGMAGRELDRAQDVFPEIGTIDYVNLGANSCRFDMAQSISPQDDLRNDPGDSIIFQITAVRSSSLIYGDPQIVWTMKQNPVFNAYRTSVFGTATSGTAGGWNTTGDNYAFDLPDTNFLFPGDILHYCIVAQDRVTGPSGDIGTSTMPADTTGFNDFSTPMAYNLSYTINCNPTIVETSPGVYEHPEILFWNDAQGYGLENEWFYALNNLGLTQGEVPGGYDVYATNGPSSGVGNGLGGRAGLGTILGYDTMLYGCANLSVNTISNGDFGNDPSNDVSLLDQWMQQGDKNMFLCGDDLITDMMVNSGAATQAFVADYFGLVHNNVNIRPLINNQHAPVVKPAPVQPVFATVNSWIAYGGCFNYNTFDAVTTDGVGQRIAEFTNPSGALGAYPYSAATLAINATYNSRVITMPYGFLFIYDDPDEVAKANAPLNARTRVLNDVLTYFGKAYSGAVGTDVRAAQQLSLSHSPNPFNPKTTISFTMPKTGHLTLKVYNVRGELVRTLVDGVRLAGPQKVDWDGTSDNGAAMSSGVYFFQINDGVTTLAKKASLLR
jgi:hypothetical protein